MSLSSTVLVADDVEREAVLVPRVLPLGFGGTAGEEVREEVCEETFPVLEG